MSAADSPDALTVLGSCGAFPEAGRAASGFLLTWRGARIVLDLGYATVPRLLTHCPYGEVDAVIVTHAHADHYADLHALSRVRRYGTPGAPRIPLYCPPEVIAAVDAMDPSERLADVFDIAPPPTEPVRIGPFRFTATPLPHHVPGTGVRLAADGLTVAYTGDSGPADALAELGRGADVFIVEATHQGPPPEGERFLLTAGEAGRYAAEAGAHRLLLTHLWPGSDPAVSLREAAADFGGEIAVAVEDLRVPFARR